jgi:phosphoglycerate dehydrogenase-like enzyme
MRLIVNALRLRPEHLAAIRERAAGLELVAVRTEEELITALPDADILCGWGRNLTAELLRKATRLRWVHMFSAGVETALTPELRAGSVILTNSRGAHGIPIAEHVMGMILAHERALPFLWANQARREWKRPAAREIWGRTIGILGLGGIGREIALRAGAFGLRVLAVRRTAGAQTPPDGVAGLFGPDQLPSFLAELDYLVVAVPLTSATRGMIGRRELAVMKPDALIVNVARGLVIDEEALIAALRAGEIRGALLDVFCREPLPPESPLWDLPNVMISPHSSAVSDRTVDRCMDIFLDNLERFLGGRPLTRVVDRQTEY